jgi:hypothetical protein
LYDPAARNVKVGFCDVEVEGVAPVHVQLQLVGVFDDISEHKIDCPVQMVLTDVLKLATGGVGPPPLGVMIALI